jgi:hypothetical protein
MISGNTATRGGGVHVASGSSFTMEGGTISGNTATWGGGVDVRGRFAMSGGIIRANASTRKNKNGGEGGGVHIQAGGSFTMKNGTISGNKADGGGGGVYCNARNGGSFVKSGGSIDTANMALYGKVVYVFESSNSDKARNSAAGLDVNLDSRRSGRAGGWE